MRSFDHMHHRLRYTVSIFLISFLSVVAAAHAGPVKNSNEVVICRSADHPVHIEATPIIAQAYARIGLKVKFVDYPSRRSLVIANEGGCFGEVTRIKKVTSLHKNLITLNVPTLTIRAFVYKWSATNAVTRWEDLAHRNFAYVRGELYARDHGKWLGGHPVTNYNQLWKLIKNKRVDYIIGLDSILRSNPDFAHLNKSKIPLHQSHSYHVLHKDNARMAPLLEKAIAEITQNRTELTLLN